jgi:RNA polymerase sigma-70 factor (ECF subfamily)
LEAARTPTTVPQRRRRDRFTTECEELRPLGIAYVLRYFGHALDRADAEDAVAEVIIRLDRRAAAGQFPDNLRAAFFTSARNAAIDQLRSRGARPTVPLELVLESPAVAPAPEERAEAGDDLVRLREAMARMRPNYREAIVLRFGLGLTVPEIAERLQISLPAAKKLVLRSTNQIRERMEAIGAAEFCPQMRAAAQRSLFDRDAAGLAEDDEAAALRAHFEHCGSCRTFLATLHRNLHELGSGALFGGYALARGGLRQRLDALLERLGDVLHSGAARARLGGYRAGGALGPEGSSPLGVLAGGGQRLAMICTAGAATTATCLATGIVGPGLGAATPPLPAVNHHAPAAKVKTQARPIAPLSHEPSPPSAEPTADSSSSTTTSHSSAAAAGRARHAEPKPQLAKASRTAPSPKPRAASPTPSEQEQSEFGFEPEAAPEPTSAPVEAPSASASTSDSTASQTSSAEPSSGSGATPKGSEQFGFGG